MKSLLGIAFTWLAGTALLCGTSGQQERAQPTEPVQTERAAPDLGPPGPAPWVTSLADQAATPGGELAERGSTHDIYDARDEALRVWQAQLFVDRAAPARRKWAMTNVGEALPMPAAFAPAGAVALVHQGQQGLVRRQLYALSGGPLVGWYVIVDGPPNEERVTDISIVTRAYLVENYAALAQAAGIR
jgi:hypothetical protein